MKKYFHYLLALSGIFLLLPLVVSAQVEDRSYNYDKIDVEIRVNTDTTFWVEETQTYNFNGEYHKGWRSIPGRKIDAVTDVEMWDIDLNTRLDYTNKQLDKTDPNSWGKYTYKKNGSGVDIEWYYDVLNTKHTWKIKYLVHGGLEFLKANDRLYWNVFTEYDVPVKNVNVKIYLPKEANLKSAGFEIYPSLGEVSDYQYNATYGYFYVGANNFEPYGILTVNLFWPKGAINRSAYWQDYWRMNFGWIISLVVIILGFVIGVWRWLKTEKFVIGRGVVVAQYEPPKQMRPVEMSVIVHEGVTARSMAAMMVDLAVRGYVEIEEEEKTSAEKVVQKILGIVIMFVFAIPLLIAVFVGMVSGPIGIIVLVPVGLVGLTVYNLLLSNKKQCDYKITRTLKSIDSLKEFEKKYLQIIFSGGHSTFSTKEMKKTKNRNRALGMHQRLEELKNEIIILSYPSKELFEVNLSSEVWKWIIWVLSGIGGFILYSIVFGLHTVWSQYVMIGISVVVVGIWLYAFYKYESRLTQAGRELKEEIMGFKLYLHTAERYHMQNLTPVIFEKFLPYAIMFRIEKYWASAFATQSMSQPGWYVGHGMSGSTGVHGGTFSATTFSASFSSSFTSAFSASLGSSGSGGSSGGGGGGGGGGAS